MVQSKNGYDKDLRPPRSRTMADDSNNTKNPVYAVLDVETTGLSRTRDRIVQIACLKIGKDGSQSTWMRYVNPCMDSEYLKEAFQIHHIPPEFLLKKMPFKDVAESFCDFLKDVDFLVAHNCLFDWDMLCREFQLLESTRNEEESSKVKENVSKFWRKKFYSTNNWLDTLRLSMICFPKRNTYRLEAIKDMLNIEPQLQKFGALSTEGDFGGDEWKAQKHDAMYDVLTTYGVLQHCMESSFHDLVQDFPMAFLDTGLLLNMQQLLNRGTTGREDLISFAKRSKEYFTTSRPKGKKLGDLSKSFLQMVTISLKADPRSDERIILIYEAAILEPLDDQMLAISSAKEDMKKEENMGNKKVVVEKDEEQDEQQKEEVKNREEEQKEGKQRTVEKKEDKQGDRDQKEEDQKAEQQKLEKKGEEQMDGDQNKIEKEKQTKEEQREVEKKWKEQREEEEQKVELEKKWNGCMEVEQNEKGKKEKQTNKDQKELEEENQMKVEKKEDEKKVEQQKLEKKIEEQVEVEENEMGKEEKQMKEEQKEMENKNKEEKQWEVENKREEQIKKQEDVKQKHEQEEEEQQQKLEKKGKELMEVEQNEREKKEEEQVEEQEKEQNQSRDDDEEDLNFSAKKRPKLSLQ